MGERRRVYWVLVEKIKEKNPLPKLRCRWENIIRKDIKDIGWEDFDWTDLVQDKDKVWGFVKTVMNFGVPYNAGNFLTNQNTVIFLRRDLLEEISYLYERPKQTTCVYNFRSSSRKTNYPSAKIVQCINDHMESEEKKCVRFRANARCAT